MSGGSSEEKTEDPTAQKLSKAREDGQTLVVPTGNKIVTFLCSIIVLVVIFPSLTVDYIALFNGSFTTPVSSEAVLVSLKQPSFFVFKFMAILFFSLTLPLIVFSALLKNGISLSFKPVMPDIARISPGSNLNNIYGKAKMIEVFLDFIKLLLWFGAGFFVFAFFIKDIFMMFQCGLTCEVGISLLIFVIIVIMMIIYAIVIIMMEISLEKKNFNTRLKMSKSEVKQERKSQHGDPQVRKKRREMNEVLKRNMPVGAKHATVAVQMQGATISVRYDPDQLGVPVIVDIAHSDRAGKSLKEARKAGASIIVDHRYGVMLMNKSVGDILNEEKEYMPILKAMF